MRLGARPAAIIALLLGVLTAPTGAAARGPSSLQFLHVGRVGGPEHVRQILDANNRQVLLRGVNVDGLVDYWRPDLRVSYPINPARYVHGACPRNDPSVEGVVLCRRDFSQMRSLGYDVIRLNLSWSLLEPSPDHISRSYINRISQVVGWARRTGMYVILDMHQDAWSKYLYSTVRDHCTAPYQPIRGYDGAPRWASLHTQPVCALDGTRELDPAVQEDFAKLFHDARASDGVGLREHFTTAVAALARRFRNDPAVAGYDLLNEPTFFKVPGTNASVLLPFYAKVIEGVRRRVHGFRQLFFIEPSAVRDLTDASSITARWSAYSSYRNVVYAPHVYTRTFTPRTFPMDGGYLSAIADARHLGLPLWIGEFGCNPADTRTILSGHYHLQDALGLGGALWLWKENANDVNPSVFWGVYGPPFGPGVPQRDRIRLTSRIYPLATAGNLHRLSYDPGTGRFRMRATSRRVRFGAESRSTIVFIPAAVRAPLHVQRARVLVVRRGRNREAFVFPRGGSYTVTTG